MRTSTATLRALRASLPTCSSHLRRRPARALTSSHSLRHLSAAAQAPCPNCHCGANGDATAPLSTSSLTPQQSQAYRGTDDKLEEEDEAEREEQQLTVAQRCDPYEQKGLPLTTETVQQLLSTLQPGWYCTTAHHRLLPPPLLCSVTHCCLGVCCAQVVRC